MRSQVEEPRSVIVRVFVVVVIVVIIVIVSVSLSVIGRCVFRGRVRVVSAVWTGASGFGLVCDAIAGELCAEAGGP